MYQCVCVCVMFSGLRESVCVCFANNIAKIAAFATGGCTTSANQTKKQKRQ